MGFTERSSAIFLPQDNKFVFILKDRFLLWRQRDFTALSCGPYGILKSCLMPRLVQKFLKMKKKTSTDTAIADAGASGRFLLPFLFLFLGLGGPFLTSETQV